MVCLLEESRYFGNRDPSLSFRVTRYATAGIWRWSSRRRISRHEERDAGGVAVQEVIAPHRADLPHCEESGDRQRSHLILDRAGVMVRSPEEPLPAAVATEDEGSRGRQAALSRALSGQQRRSEEHTSELQSQSNLVCRLLLEK